MLISLTSKGHTTMRKNTKQVIGAFLAGEGCKKYPSIWTDGKTIFSYGTPILHRVSESVVVFNGTKYSHTTTQQQNSIRVALSWIGAFVFAGDDFPRGIPAYKLAEAAGY